MFEQDLGNIEAELIWEAETRKAKFLAAADKWTDKKRDRLTEKDED